MFRHFRYHWRRFRPHFHRRQRAMHEQFRRRNLAHDRRYIGEPVDVPFVCNSDDFFDCGEEQIVSLLQRRPEINALDRTIDQLRERFIRTDRALDGYVALLAQVPRAVLAQIQMDKSPHGYHNKQERLYELIDFNDTLVGTILILDQSHREEFAERVKQAADRICKRVGAPCFSEEQWGAIIRGLMREIAVYEAARENGFEAVMTDRAHDALGIDLQVRDPSDGRYINLDVKTPSSFRHRMEQLVQEARLTERELVAGDQKNYIIERNGHMGKQAEVIVLCILPDVFGDLANWQFVDSAPMRTKLNQLIRDHGLHDGGYGAMGQSS